MKVEDKPLTMPPAEKTQEVWQPENDFRTGFLTVFSLQSPSSAAVRKPPVFRAPPRPTAPIPSVSHILRRNARSRVRLNERALNLKQRASDPSDSLS
jgi:hypothetical protein